VNWTAVGTVRAVGRRAVAGLVLAAALADTALAHGGEESSSGLAVLHSRAVAAALFLLGVVALAASIYLDYEGRASRRATDAGVGLGVLCVLGSIAALWI